MNDLSVFLIALSLDIVLELLDPSFAFFPASGISNVDVIVWDTTGQAYSWGLNMFLNSTQRLA